MTNRDTQEMKIIKLQPYRCAEFVRIRARFDADIAVLTGDEQRGMRPVDKGQVFRLKRTKAQRLNYHLDYCRECG